jgi:photosystem II stability/assembly factor-like uncharacterized protein
MKKQFLYLLFVILGVSASQEFAQWMPTYITEITPSLAPKYGMAGSKVYAGTFQGIYVSSDSGENWDTLWTAQSDTIVYSLATINNWIFAGTRNGGLLRSSNGGQNWFLLNNGLPAFNIRGIEIVANDLGDTVIFAGTAGGGIYKSSNFGVSWLPANNGLTNFYIFSFIALDNSTSEVQIFAASIGDGIYKSTDLGNSWVTSNNGLTSIDVRVFTSNTFSGTTNLFAGTHNGGMYMSTNAGDSWTQINNGLVSNYIWALTSTPGNSASPKIFAGLMMGGVYKSTNNGMLWEAYNDGFPNTYTYALAIIGDYILVGTQDAGVMRRLVDGTSDASDLQNNFPADYSLRQNYPNPFNPSTTIRYTIPSVTLSPDQNGINSVEGSRVQLQVYDVLGNEVATLVNEEKPAGSYEVTFDASSLTSGVYFYKISAGSFIQTKKMLLLK